VKGTQGRVYDAWCGRGERHVPCPWILTCVSFGWHVILEHDSCIIVVTCVN
jgi:hypothetical protein